MLVEDFLRDCKFRGMSENTLINYKIDLSDFCYFLVESNGISFPGVGSFIFFLWRLVFHLGDGSQLRYLFPVEPNPPVPRSVSSNSSTSSKSIS